MTLPKPDAPSRPAESSSLSEEGLYAPLKSLTGLGARGEELLTKLLAKPLTPPRVIDLLWHLPSGYLDRRLSSSIQDAAPGSVATLLVKPVRYNAPSKGAARAPLRVVSEDESASLDIVFFHGDRNAVKRLLPLNELRLVSGRVEKYGSWLQMAHPDYILAPAESGKLPAIEPIYPLTLGLTQKFLYRAMGSALSRLPDFPEWLDATLAEAESWPSFGQALHLLHRPQTLADVAAWPKAREGSASTKSSRLSLPSHWCAAAIARCPAARLWATAISPKRCVRPCPTSLPGRRNRRWPKSKRT